jgi:2-polyprenyl-3-methyl-5-hydroxy-6-metoxy-1,4-benzoquinol methylase
MKPLDCLDVYADAEFYEQEFATRGHEIPFFLQQAELSKGPVLEVACGTGRITLPIARAGIEITGLDVSRPMLDLARRKAEAENLAVTWIEQDCRQINCTQSFALIFSATNAMQHLCDLDSVNAFLTSARHALRSGGTLIIDVFNPNPAKLARSAETRYHHKLITDASGKQICVEATSEYYSAAQILAINLYYLRDGVLAKTKKVNMRCFYPEELLALCHFNGLEITRRYGDYDMGSFTNNSPKQILVCQNTSKTG